LKTTVFPLKVPSEVLEPWSQDETTYPTRRRGLPAWLLSLGFHTSVLVAAGLLVRSTPPQAGRVPERTAGIALVQRAPSRVSYFSEAEAQASSPTREVATESSSAGLPGLNDLPLELAATLPSREGLRDTIGDRVSLPGADGLARGKGPSRRIQGGGATTQVFGVTGTGSRFVYVFDRSASMAGFGGRPMRAAKRELTASLGDLESVHQFQIVFYNERTSVFNPHRPQLPKLMFGTKPNKRLAEEFIDEIQPAGGTRHFDAVTLALGMRPDVIFLLTDAAEPQLTPSELVRIRKRNRGGTAINTIEFGTGPVQDGDNFLVRLARQNDGQHVYVNVSRLPEGI
jgi:hypothetical protein